MEGATFHRGQVVLSVAHGIELPARDAKPPTLEALFTVVDPLPSVNRRFNRRLEENGTTAVSAEQIGTAATVDTLAADSAVFQIRTCDEKGWEVE
jgi:hypothetical protein